MFKRDVEKTVELCWRLGKHLFHKNVSVVDVYALAVQIWNYIKEEETQKEGYYIIDVTVSKDDVDKLVSDGELVCDDEDGYPVVIKISD